ncbi:MAG: hypothetical protein KBS62_06895, partial [Oscillospiraceae bacterium]|nr:hypothetical protein [Candidatus Ruminococcus equi]
MATEKVKVLNIDTKSAQTSVGDLRKKIKDLRSELLNMEKGTDAYRQKAQELGNTMHELVAIQESAKFATQDFGQKMSNVSSIIGAASASIAGLTGVLSLFGVEGNKSTEEITKMITSFMAIAQAASSVDVAKKAFVGLSNAIGMSTKALGVWGIALAAVVAAFELVKNAINKKVEAEERDREEMEKNIQKEKEYQQMLQEIAQNYVNYNLRIARATGDRKQELAFLKLAAKDAEDAYNRALKQYGNLADTRVLKAKAEWEEAKKAVRDFGKTASTSVKATAKDTTDYLHLIERLRMSELELLEDDLNIAETMQSKVKAGTQEWNKYQYEIEKAKIKIEEFKESLKNQTFEAGPMSDPEEYWEEWFEAQKKAYETQLKATENIYNSMRIATPEGDFEQQLYIEKAYIDRRRELYQAMYEQQMLDKEEFDAKMIELDESSLNVQQTLYQEYVNGIADISSSLTGTLSSLSSMFEQSSAEYKSLKIAETIISTLTSIMKTWEGYASMGVLGIGAAAAQTAMLATTGATTIAKIARVDVSGKSNNTSTISTPRYSINSQATNAITTDYQKSQL